MNVPHLLMKTAFFNETKKCRQMMKTIKILFVHIMLYHLARDLLAVKRHFTIFAEIRSYIKVRFLETSIGIYRSADIQNES